MSRFLPYFASSWKPFRLRLNVGSDRAPGVGQEIVPQRLKPQGKIAAHGTAEAVPYQKLRSALGRARLQPCHFAAQGSGALAPKVRPRTRAANLFRSRLLQSAIVCCLAIVMLGADNTDRRYDRIGHNMMCACGCGQILLECNHVGCPDSARMDNELRTMVDGGNVGTGSNIATGGSDLASGGSDKAILNWFIAKYGATVLASPIRGGFDNVAWIMPISVFLIAILGTALIARVWKARTAHRTPLKIAGMTASSTDELRERIRRETHY